MAEVRFPTKQTPSNFHERRSTAFTTKPRLTKRTSVSSFKRQISLVTRNLHSLLQLRKIKLNGFAHRKLSLINNAKLLDNVAPIIAELYHIEPETQTFLWTLAQDGQHKSIMVFELYSTNDEPDCRCKDKDALEKIYFQRPQYFAIRKYTFFC